MQNGFGIYAVSENAEKLEVVNTDINNFNKSAVITRSEIELYMKGCNIKGFGEQGVISQNGIQYAGDTTITNCSVEDLKYVADNEWTADQLLYIIQVLIMSQQSRMLKQRASIIL